MLLRRLLPLSLLAAIAVTLFVLLRPEKVIPVSGVATGAENEAQTYLVNSLAQRFNKHGELEEVLVSPRVDYYASTATSVLEQPHIWRLGLDGQTWQAWSAVGEVQHEPELMVLRGDVVLRRTADGSELHSAEMWLAVRDDQAFTETEVTILESGRRTSAKSLKMNLRSGETQLRDQVESVYEPK